MTCRKPRATAITIQAHRTCSPLGLPDSKLIQVKAKVAETGGARRGCSPPLQDRFRHASVWCSDGWKVSTNRRDSYQDESGRGGRTRCDQLATNYDVRAPLVSRKHAMISAIERHSWAGTDNHRVPLTGDYAREARRLREETRRTALVSRSERLLLSLLLRTRWPGKSYHGHGW